MHCEYMEDGEYLKASDTLFLREDFKHTFAVSDFKARAAQKNFKEKKQRLASKQAVMEKLRNAMKAKLMKKSFARGGRDDEHDDSRSHHDTDTSRNLTFQALEENATEHDLMDDT